MRVEKNVPHYRGDNEFSILTGGTFTFKTVSLAGGKNTCTQSLYVRLSCLHG